MSKFISAEEYCIKVFDGTHDTPKPLDSGFPLVTSKHIVGRNLDFSTAYFISENDYNSIQKRSAVSQWDVLFSMIGSVGEVYLEKNSIIPYAIKNIGVFSCGDEFKAKWLYYFLQSPHAITHIKRYLNGAVQKFLPLGALRNFPIFEFNKNSKIITKVLSDLDTKIELNNRINRELEAMAKTLYDYWFVQFDFPNEQGKPYKSTGGKMVYNAELKREIPEGWEVKNIFKCSNVQYGFPFSTDYFNTDGKGVPVIRIRDILENSISNYSFEQNIDAKYLIKKGDILVGMDGNFHINYWAKDGCYLNQRAVKLSETILPNIYLKYQIEPFIKLREKSVSRTTVGHLSDKDLKALSIIIPSKEVLSSISSIYNGLLKRMIQTQNENQQLTELRDWLLPMLMNGQVTVKEAEERLRMAAEPSVEYKKG